MKHFLQRPIFRSLYLGAPFVALALIASGCTVFDSNTPVQQVPVVSDAATTETTEAVDAQTGTIVVTGQGVAKVKPDTATVRIAVNTLLSEGPAESQAKNAEISNKVIASLERNGITDADIQTAGYRLQKDERYDSRTQQSEYLGWRTFNYISATVPFDTLDDVLTDAVVGDEVSFQDVQLSVENTSDAEVEARTQALANAAEEAQDIAAAMGVEIVGLSDISEGEHRLVSANGTTCIECGGGGTPIAQQGTSEYQYSVTVAYTIK